MAGYLTKKPTDALPSVVGKPGWSGLVIPLNQFLFINPLTVNIMKKIINITALFVLVSFAAQAQEVRFGLKGGANISSYLLDKDQIEDTEGQWGFQAGIVTEISLTERFALQPELLYVNRGAQYRVAGITVEEDINSLDLPVLLKFKPLEVLNVYAGPQVSFLLNGKYEYGDEGVNFEFDDRDDFNTIDYGFVVGAGVELGSFFVDARYSLGLNNALEDREINDVFLENEDAKNNGVQVSVGFLF